MKTRLTELLGIELPLIQAPMAGVSTPEMAAAVSNAGGLGSVALGAVAADAARAALEATRARTQRPIAANVFVHPTPRTDVASQTGFMADLAVAFKGTGVPAPARLEEIYRSFNDDDEMLEVLLACRPEVVSLHFGPAAPDRMKALLDAGIKVLATATSVAEAQVLESSGVHGLVMQGIDAGGHSGAFLGEPDTATRGRSGLTALVRATVERVTVPVVAAGGLMNGEDVRQVIEAGAAGAQLGTAFIRAPESLASNAYRAALVAGVETSITAAISGRPARGLVNALMAWAGNVQSTVADYPLTYDGVKQLIAAKNDPDFSVMWAGTGAQAARDLPAGELIRTISKELDALSAAGARNGDR
jgi:nitronate monooxygenase